jgi:hypothetical protein
VLDLDALFASVERSAFRFEILGRGPHDPTVNLPWHQPELDVIRRVVDAGRTVHRVQVVDEPPTAAQRFERSLTAYHERAGEVVRVLGRPRAVALALPLVDFWLLDDVRVVTLEFDELGLPGRTEVSRDPSVAREHRRRWRLAWEAGAHVGPSDPNV